MAPLYVYDNDPNMVFTWEQTNLLASDIIIYLVTTVNIKRIK